MNSNHPFGRLDNPVWHALRGEQRDLSVHRGNACRYQPDVARFAGLPDDPAAADWADLAVLAGRRGISAIVRAEVMQLPAEWERVMTIYATQMVSPALPTDRLTDSAAADSAVIDSPSDDAAIIELDPADVPDMLDLVARTKPGPFLPRTIELGRYVGIRQQGRLVAMAGTRMRLQGWTELSAVCADESVRGRGFAHRLVLLVVQDNAARNDRTFLHVDRDNTAARGLYRKLGFEPRRDVEVQVVRSSA